MRRLAQKETLLVMFILLVFNPYGPDIPVHSGTLKQCRKFRDRVYKGDWTYIVRLKDNRVFDDF